MKLEAISVRIPTGDVVVYFVDVTGAGKRTVVPVTELPPPQMQWVTDLIAYFAARLPAGPSPALVAEIEATEKRLAELKQQAALMQ